jgi:hypothetical protein
MPSVSRLQGSVADYGFCQVAHVADGESAGPGIGVDVRADLARRLADAATLRASGAERALAIVVSLVDIYHP